MEASDRLREWVAEVEKAVADCAVARVHEAGAGLRGKRCTGAIGTKGESSQGPASPVKETGTRGLSAWAEARWREAVRVQVWEEEVVEGVKGGGRGLEFAGEGFNNP